MEVRLYKHALTFPHPDTLMGWERIVYGEINYCHGTSYLRKFITIAHDPITDDYSHPELLALTELAEDVGLTVDELLQQLPDDE